jgi:hypothetical protein
MILVLVSSVMVVDRLDEIIVMLKVIDQKLIKHEFVIGQMMMIVVLMDELMEDILIMFEKNDKLMEYLMMLFAVEVLVEYVPEKHCMLI